MKKIVFLLLCLLAIALAFYILNHKDHKRTVKLTDMPWQIEISAGGGSHVFGINLGETTLAQLQQDWKQFQPDIGLFTSREQHQRLEAYLGNRRLGLFDAKVILGLEVSPSQMKAFAEDRINIKPMPSGDFKQEISEDHLREAFQLPIHSITYIPKVKYDPTLMQRYFSEPADRIALNNEAAFWLYPDQGLAVLLDPNGREVFHYVKPAKFPELLERLKSEATADQINGLPAMEADNP